MQFNLPLATDGAKTTQFDSNFQTIERGRQMQAVANVAVNQFQVVYLNASGKWALWIGDTTSLQATSLFVSLATVNASTVLFAQYDGIVTNAAWTWTPFIPLWVTAGSALTATSFDLYEEPIGFAISATEVLLVPYFRAARLSCFGNTSTTASAGGIASPGNYQGFLLMRVNGIQVKIPFFNP
jgi:hypothetical protein